ncbi:hypothetical protein H671_8g19462 [Cricetulus griseus]|uniref:Uncharacterized protein n=1 Tax=Cricetulus griseus TaxID=10029 RepID=A0A061I231_CRIGR|nr:hypothetical protein H671_8g19462 [Cricetulus griseus]
MEPCRASTGRSCRQSSRADSTRSPFGQQLKKISSIYGEEIVASLIARSRDRNLQEKLLTSIYWRPSEWSTKGGSRKAEKYGMGPRSFLHLRPSPTRISPS